MPLYVRLEWPVSLDAVPLSATAGERLAVYLTRYAQTLGVPVRETAWEDHQVLLVVELPPTLSLNQVTIPLREASARFARDTVGVAGFVWATEGVRADSVAGPEQIGAAGEMTSDDEIPAWLTDVLAARSKETEK